MIFEPTEDDKKYGWAVNHGVLLGIKRRCRKMKAEFVPAEEYIEAVVLALMDLGLFKAPEMICPTCKKTLIIEDQLWVCPHCEHKHWPATQAEQEQHQKELEAWWGKCKKA